jgi:hypothetical protein
MNTIAPDKDFLALNYVSHQGSYPIGARSAREFHPWGLLDNIYLAAELEVEPCTGTDDGYVVWAADISRKGGSYSTGADSVSWYKAGPFHTFTDAEYFAQFAYQRWRATARFSASGMRWRADLDANRKPLLP